MFCLQAELGVPMPPASSGQPGLVPDDAHASGASPTMQRQSSSPDPNDVPAIPHIQDARSPDEAPALEHPPAGSSHSPHDMANGGPGIADEPSDDASMHVSTQCPFKPADEPQGARADGSLPAESAQGQAGQGEDQPLALQASRLQDNQKLHVPGNNPAGVSSSDASLKSMAPRASDLICSEDPIRDAPSVQINSAGAPPVSEHQPVGRADLGLG